MQHVRIALLVLYSICQSAASDALGTWKVNLARSRARYSNITAISFQFHSKGEIFTVYRIGREGRATTSSTILYFDGRDREIEDFDCRGTQSSRKVAAGLIEITRTCDTGQRVRLLRRVPLQGNQLILDITEDANGDRIDRRLILERK